MLRAHALLVAAIFIPYMVLMITLGAYMWHQVRDHEKPGNDEEDREQDPGDLAIARRIAA